MKKLNRRLAIRARCLDCSGFSKKEIRECPITECSLYPFRMATGYQEPRTRDKAIRSYCLGCMNGQMGDVQKCPSTDCHLFIYRHTGIRKCHIAQPMNDESPAEGLGRGCL